MSKEYTLSDLVSLGYTISEAKVMQQVVLGKSNKEAANVLCVSEKTTKFHLTNIYRKSGVKSRSELMAKFMVIRPLNELPRGSVVVPPTDKFNSLT